MLSDAQRTVLIRKGIATASKELKEKYSFLKHQNTIGFTIFLFSVTGIVISSLLYIIDNIPAGLTIILNAFFMSILHELEHDLIHWMYFRKKVRVHNFMLFIIWILRPLTINPWLRRELHFHHHKYSGTLHDVEERGVTNGEKWGIRRLISTPDLMLGGILRANQLKKEIREEVVKGNLSREQALRFKEISMKSMFPFGLVAHFIWYVFIVHYGIHFITSLINIPYQSPNIIQQQFVWLNPIVVILILPNILRQFCLHFITSNMHYFGDVESGNILQQTQVLNVWWTFPLQLFCFFFGWTHAIHHFVVNETFYIRHITRKKAHAIMKENGVRFNDIGTFKRANRYSINK